MASAFSKEYNRISLTPLIGRKRTHPANFVESFQYYTHTPYINFYVSIMLFFLAERIIVSFFVGFCFPFFKKNFFPEKDMLNENFLINNKAFLYKNVSTQLYMLAFGLYNLRERERERKQITYVHT